ncbi:MAG: NAD(P)/FAD-dependent oxidoreductase [Thermoplasmata archaeon]
MSPTRTSHPRRILVLGAGIVGAACAEALASDGHEVTLVDRGEIAGGTTQAGMGHVVVITSSPALLALTRYSQQEWIRHASRWDARVPVRQCGTLWVARERTEEMTMVDRLERELSANDIPSERYGATEIHSAEPHLAETVEVALKVPDDLVVDAVAATHRLVEEAKRHGARVRTGTLVERVSEHGALLVDGSWIEADELVVAAGVDSVRLLPALGLRPRKGHLVHVGTPTEYIHAQLGEIGYAQGAASDADEAVSFNVQPAPRGGLYVGASRQYDATSPDVEERIVQLLFTRAREFLPGIGRYPVLRRWTGFRPAAPDHRPFIGRWPDRAGLWVATGHEGLGITCSLGTGRLLADMIAEREPAISSAPFRPDGRLLGPTDADFHHRG